MVDLKTSEEIGVMAEGGRLAAVVLGEALKMVESSPTTRKLDRFIEERIRSFGASPSFKDFQGYGFASCINVNEGVVHGVPGNYPIREGDVVSVDLGVFFKGFHTDVSWTVLVGSSSRFPERYQFLAAGQRALKAAVAKARLGNRVGDISAAMQTVVEAGGYAVVRELVGHGVGRQLHEEPAIPCYGKKGRGVELAEGMTLAVEVIYTAGRSRLKLSEDGWTIATANGIISALFEQTIAVTNRGPRILTAFGRR